MVGGDFVMVMRGEFLFVVVFVKVIVKVGCCEGVWVRVLKEGLLVGIIEMWEFFVVDENNDCGFFVDFLLVVVVIVRLLVLILMMMGWFDVVIVIIVLCVIILILRFIFILIL